MKRLNLKNTFLHPGSYTPRWVIFLLDIGSTIVSITLSFIIFFNFGPIPVGYPLPNLSLMILAIVCIRGLTFLVFRPHANIIRYTNIEDAGRIAVVVLSGSLIIMLLNITSYLWYTPALLIPISVITLDFLITIFLMNGLRLLVKSLYHHIHHTASQKGTIVIYGADEYGIITKQTLERDAGNRYRVVAFFDNQAADAGKKMENLNIHHLDELPGFLEEFCPDRLILAKKDIRHRERKQVIEDCLDYGTKIMSVPDFHSWVNGSLSFNQIKQIEIEDLLERDPIVLDKRGIRQQLAGNTILITGAAGSIGSEICRQLIDYGPKKLILLDQAETPLYDLELELQEKFHFSNYQIIIGDISHEKSMEQVFETYRPSVVYHAAAYKHVPMMESHPAEAVRANISGTRIIAGKAHAYATRQFVMISTDKAVKPTNVMGATKRIAELYIRAMNEQSSTQFVTTRFGNVLGSSGSVIVRFKKQIEQGGPITITHPEITRYFMTLSEACQLVLEAGSMAKGGEIYLFDMGDAQRIIDLARKMVRISGLEPEKDIPIVYTGLRPGEKLHEELVNDGETPQPTHHSKIMIVREDKGGYGQIHQDINQLEALCRTGKNAHIIDQMQQMIPEYSTHRYREEKEGFINVNPED